MTNQRFTSKATEITGYYYDKERKRYFRIAHTNEVRTNRYSSEALREEWKAEMREKDLVMKENARQRKTQTEGEKRKQVLSMKQQIMVSDVNGLCRYLLMDPRLPSMEDIKTFLEYKKSTRSMQSSFLKAFQQKIRLQNMCPCFLKLPIEGSTKVTGFYKTSNYIYSLTDESAKLMFEKLAYSVMLRIKHEFIGNKKIRLQDTSLGTIDIDSNSSAGCIYPGLNEDDQLLLKVKMEYNEDSTFEKYIHEMNIVKIIFDRMQGPMVVYYIRAKKTYYAAYISHMLRAEEIIPFQGEFNNIFPFFFKGRKFIAFDIKRNGSYVLHFRGAKYFNQAYIKSKSLPNALCQSQLYTYIAFKDGKIKIYKTEDILIENRPVLYSIETNAVICQIEIILNEGGTYLLASGLNSFLALYKISMSTRSISAVKYVTYTGYINTFDYLSNFRMIKDSPFFIISTRESSGHKPSLLLYYMFQERPLDWIKVSINRPESSSVSLNLSFDFFQGRLFVLNSEQPALLIYG